MVKVLITGGSGFLGINLVRYLLDKGYEVRTLDIEEFDYEDVRDKIEFIKGDVRNREVIKKSLEGVDYVVHTAAALPLYKRKEIFSTEVNGTHNLLEEAYKKGVKRFVHISTTAVYGIPDHHPITEDDKLEGVGDYGEAKILAEKECQKYRNEGMIIPILRPKSFVGPERLGVLAIYYEWIKDGKNIPIVGKGNNYYQLLDVEDLCEAIYITLIEKNETVDDTFNIGAKEFSTMKEDFGSVIKYAGTGKRIISTHAKPLILILRFLEILHLSPLYKWVYETAPKDSYVSIEKAEKKLGFTPKFSNKDALIRNYKWYLKNYKRYGKTGVSHKAPWKQGILKFFKIFF